MLSQFWRSTVSTRDLYIARDCKPSASQGRSRQITAGTCSAMVSKHCLHVMFAAACSLLEVLSLSTCCAFTHLILIILESVVFIILVYACVFKNVNKLESSTRVHRNTWGRVTGTEKGLGNRQRGSELS